MPNYVVIGLGMGDEAKGATVDYLCSTQEIDLVVRFNGGFQAAHNVVMSDGRHHCFSQFGSGTLRGVNTYLDRHVIVEPMSLRAEARHLTGLIGDPSTMIAIHPDCLVATMYHQVLNRIQDKRSGHGSCGVGIGAVRSMWSKTGDGLKWADLQDKRIIRRKLDWIRQWCQDQLVDYTDPTAERYDINIDVDGCINNVFDEADLLYNSAYGIMISDNMNVSTDANVVFEGSQGYRLDEVFGTIPHTTYSNTRPTYALELCDYQGLEKPKIYGLTRAYETRHGNGPMHNEDFDGIFDVSKDHNKGGFAGKFRAGALDVASVKEAYWACKCDAMIVNCMDHVAQNTQNFLINEFSPEIVSYGRTAEDRKRLR